MAGDGKLYYYCGSSRSGKSKSSRKRLAKAKKILVWDVKDEYGRPWDKAKSRPDRTKVLRGWVITRTKLELITALRSSYKKNFKICHVPEQMGEFEFWSQCAYQFGQLVEMDIVGEELADVTTPSKAPAGWGNVCRKLLGFGCNVYAITQRPAESDKTALGNASIVRCCRLTRFGDMQTMAKQLNVPVNDVQQLKQREFIERHDTGELVTGKI